jgi:hypothetical protein
MSVIFIGPITFLSHAVSFTDGRGSFGERRCWEGTEHQPIVQATTPQRPTMRAANGGPGGGARPRRADVPWH